MPSVFQNLVSGNLPAYYRVYGLPATYAAPDGTIVTGLLVRLTRHEVREVPTEVKASGVLQTGELMIQQGAGGSDGGGMGTVKPVKGGRFEVDTMEVWTIETPPVLRNGQYLCTVTRFGKDRLMEKRAGSGGGHG